jgi:putative membrane protein
MLGFERNHYDRLVHLAYGLLLTAPIREILPSTDRIGTAWRLFLPVAVVLSLSAAYEILEWAAAATLGGEIGIAYVGAQGDVWDAEKDMALATAGALLTSALAIASERLRA